MRQLRELPDRDGALLLCDALSASGVEIELMESQRGTFAVWVVDEAQLQKAQQLADAWLEGGQAAAMEEAARKGRASRELTARIEERRQRQRQAVIERDGAADPTAPHAANLGPDRAVRGRLRRDLRARCEGHRATGRHGGDVDDHGCA